VTPPPREALAGVELAHIFDTGWAIGKICSKIKRHLACLVPRQWLHKLDIEMYGEDKFWVIVERTSGSATPQESPLVHAMSTEQLHARANTLQRNRLNMLRHNKERGRRRERVQETEAEEEAEAETAAEGSQWRRLSWRRRKQPRDRGIGRGSRDT
jgi:hypothetical protein